MIPSDQRSGGPTGPAAQRRALSQKGRGTKAELGPGPWEAWKAWKAWKAIGTPWKVMEVSMVCLTTVNPPAENFCCRLVSLCIGADGWPAGPAWPPSD